MMVTNYFLIKCIFLCNIYETDSGWLRDIQSCFVTGNFYCFAAVLAKVNRWTDNEDDRQTLLIIEPSQNVIPEI